jgi:plastocyanin
MRTLLIGALLTAMLALAAPAGAGSTAQIVIRHQMKGCHTWAVGNQAYRATQHVTVARGTTFTLVNNDVMPHTLIQLAGQKVALGHALLNHMGASTKFTLAKPGTYRFGTKAGEDYKGMAMKTIGEDNVLRLVVVVS